MTLPPYAALIGATLAADGATVVLPFGAVVIGRPGFLHGGAIGGLLELAGRTAVKAALGGEAATIDLITQTVDYRRGGRERTTRAVATVTRMGLRTAHAEAVAWQDDRDRPIATARLIYALARA